MKYITLFLVLLLFSVARPLKAQVGIQQLHIGDTLPDMLVNLYNPENNIPVNLYDLKKGKYLIIDFFATWCAPCIRSLENLNVLQTKFQDNLSIVVVTYEHRSVFQSFATRNNIGKKNQLPVIVQDTLLKKLLPYRIVPHEVWVDEKGIVRFTSTHEDVTQENLSKFIQNESLSIKQKKDLVGYDYRLPLKTGDTGFIYRSLVTHGNPGLPTRTYSNQINISDNFLSRIVVTNRSLMDLFYIAYRKGEPSLTNFNHIYMEVSDSTLYIRPSYITSESKISNEEWENLNHFNYEKIVPRQLHDSIFFKDMFADLNRISPLRGEVIKKKTRCWVLVNTVPYNKLLETKGGKKMLIWKGEVLEKLQNIPIKSLVRYLNSYRDNFMIIDETHYDKPVDMVVNVDAGNGGRHLDIPALQKALKRYGLDLVLKERTVDMLYLTDK